MSETVFVVKELEAGWDWNDVHSDEDIQEYCEEQLEIPLESINRINFHRNAFELRLKRDRKEFREDWYVNLQRISA